MEGCIFLHCPNKNRLTVFYVIYILLIEQFICVTHIHHQNYYKVYLFFCKQNVNKYKNLALQILCSLKDKTNNISVMSTRTNNLGSTKGYSLFFIYLT